MINVSNEFKTLMSERQDFKEYAEVTLANGTVLELTEDDFSIDNNSLVDSAGANSIPLGVALSRNVQLEIMNDDDHLSDYDFFGAKIRLYLTFELSSTIEKIEYGTFTVTQPETYGSVVTIVGYDDMYKADKTYSTTLTFPATAKSVLIDSCDTCGILIGNSNFLHNDFQIPTMPSSEYTHRQIIGFIAMIACGNARIDRTGHLQIMTYDFNYDSGNVHTLTDYNTLTNDTNDVQVTGVQMTKTVTKTTTDEDGNENEEDVEELVKYGSDGYVLEIENPLVAGHEETLVSWIYERFKDVTFRGFTMDYISYPIAEFGDKIKITDWRGKSFYSVLTDVNFVFFGYTTLKNSAESPMRNQSNYTSSEQKALIQGKELVEREKTNREIAVKKLNDTLKNSSGMYSTAEKQPDGSTIYYLHDKPTIAESQNVIKLTAETIGFSTDGGKNYPYGFTITGEMITRLLYVEGINADYINTGALTVKDKSGNIIFFADIETGTVRISGDNVTIGGKTATEAINDAINEAKKSRAMIINLDKDYQAITTDYKGEYTAFPECHTTAQVLWGHTDISNDCSYSIQKSSGIVGSWDNTTHTYTVTALIADTGWIDITANYLDTYTVTKRFDVAKVKSGAPGAQGDGTYLHIKYSNDGGKTFTDATVGSWIGTCVDSNVEAPLDVNAYTWAKIEGKAGRTYFMETSSSIVKMSADSTIVPNFITLSGYYRDGTETARTAYKCRFKIEETADNETYNTVYTSTEDETDITHALYSALATGSNGISADETNGIAISRNLTALRCTMYAAGGFTQILDIETIPVAIDVDALTHEDIFNLLTNNGAWQGIYRGSDGKLYINFTYGRGGTLNLGGKADTYGDGELHVYNYFDKEVVTIDKEGVLVQNYSLGISADEKPASYTCLGRKLFSDGMYISENKDGSGKCVLISPGTLIAKDDDKSASTIIFGNRVEINASKGIYCEPTGWSKEGPLFQAENYNSGSLVEMNADKINMTGDTTLVGTLGIAGYTSIDGDFNVTGSKNRIIDTENYDTRKQYCYETATPYFGDIGTAQTDDKGKCYIDIDDIFSETVNTGVEYQVFLQKEGQGDLWVEEKTDSYFVVRGTENLKFSWEIKAIQRDYEFERLEKFDNSEKEEVIDYEKEYMEEINDLIKEQEEMLNETVE
jgi:hypothetical protein|nr:MAG TPA: hypothetical protein [Caudoviricetes sp.]